MKCIPVLSIFLAMLLLSSCAKSKPTVSVTPETSVTADASTTAAGGSSLGSAPIPTATPPPDTTYTVQRATLDDLLTFNAKITPAQYPMSFSQDGVIKAIFVKPGQIIKEGDLVAQLDLGDLESQLNEAQLALQQSQRAIDQATQIGLLDVQKAQLDLEAAQQDLAKTKAPPSALLVAQAQATVRGAQANLATVRNNASQAKNQAKAIMDKAVLDLQSIQTQYGEAVVKLKKATGQAAKDLDTKVKTLEDQMRAAQTALETAAINYDTARNNEAAAVSAAEGQLDLARAQLDDLLKGPDKFIIADKERAVRAAEIVVAQVHQRTTSDPALLKSVQSGNLQIKLLQNQITARQLYSPMSGEVATINLNPGDTVQVGNPVITLVDRARLNLSASQADILAGGRSTMPQLALKQAVAITFSRYQGKTFSGTISRVPAVAASATATTDTTYNFAFDDQGLSFDPGDQAEIKITLGRKVNALYLPPAAVRTVRDRSSVTVRTGDQDKRVDVVIGIVTPDKVEIISGIKEGDVVLAVTQP
ncbi:MAG: HlyD family efflux transporter periplasmic adaptor subunit [Chloroflexales bacterium]